MTILSLATIRRTLERWREPSSLKEDYVPTHIAIYNFLRPVLSYPTCIKFKHGQWPKPINKRNYAIAYIVACLIPLAAWMTEFERGHIDLSRHGKFPLPELDAWVILAIEGVLTFIPLIPFVRFFALRWIAALGLFLLWLALFSGNQPNTPGY
jgi:hypothetical protein